MGPAEHLVADLPCSGVPHHHLGALRYHQAVDGAGLVGALRTAPAQWADGEGLHPVGQFHQPLRSGKQLGSEVREDPESVDVDLQLVHDPGKLFHLLPRVELRLVADEIVDPPARHQLGDDVGPEVEFLVHLGGRRFEAQPGGNPCPARAVPGREYPALSAVRGLGVVELQGKGRLSAVHGTGVEDEFRHSWLRSAPRRWKRRSRRCAEGSVLRAGPGTRNASRRAARDRRVSASRPPGN